MTMTRRTYSDPGCVPPEEICKKSKAFYPESSSSSSSSPLEQKLIDEEEETVVMSNVDRRPAGIGKIEKLNKICSIPEEERAARDRQLIDMYTRKTNKTKSKSDGHIGLTLPAFGLSPVPKSPSPQNSQVPVKTPGKSYPYYDIVVVEPASKVFGAEISCSPAATKPRRSESPFFMWRRNPRRNNRKLQSSNPEVKKHEVIVPPFGPRFNRTESPLFTWQRNPPKDRRQPHGGPKEHQVILPPFSPKPR